MKYTVSLILLFILHTVEAAESTVAESPYHRLSTIEKQIDHLQPPSNSVSEESIDEFGGAMYRSHFVNRLNEIRWDLEAIETLAPPTNRATLQAITNSPSVQSSSLPSDLIQLIASFTGGLEKSVNKLYFKLDQKAFAEGYIYEISEDTDTHTTTIKRGSFKRKWDVNQ